MNHQDRNPAAPATELPPSSAPPTFVAPPPAGYPTSDPAAQNPGGPVETKSRGDGFCKGCCAALCCCCMLDACF